MTFTSFSLVMNKKKFQTESNSNINPIVSNQIFINEQLNYQYKLMSSTTHNPKCFNDIVSVGVKTKLHMFF